MISLLGEPAPEYHRDRPLNRVIFSMDSFSFWGDLARNIGSRLTQPPNSGEVAPMDRVGIERLDGRMVGYSALALLCSSLFGNGDFVALGA